MIPYAPPQPPPNAGGGNRNWINVLFATVGLGLGLSGLAIQLVLGGLGIVLGLFNFFNAIRLRVKLWITYAICWAMLYLGGHVVIAYYQPHHFSIWTSVWTLGFLGLTSLMSFQLGGLALDVTILISSLTDEQFNALIEWLSNEEDQTEENRPSWFHPLRRILENAGHILTLPTPALRGLLQIWRQTGQGFFRFLKFINMVAVLVGMYFLWFPPSNNWNLFFASAVAFTGFALSGPGFNWERWNRVCILALILQTLAGTFAFQEDWDFDEPFTWFVIAGLFVVVGLVFGFWKKSPNNTSTTINTQGGGHGQSH